MKNICSLEKQVMKVKKTTEWEKYLQRGFLPKIILKILTIQ